MKCYRCSIDLKPFDYGRADVCPGCRFDTRVCKNCIHYDASMNNQCRETQADRVVEKERSNFCDYFEPGSPDQKENHSRKAEAIKLAAEALFKKK